MSSAEPRFLERSLLFSPIAIRLVDQFTLGPPIGNVELKLFADGDTEPTDIRVTHTADGVFSYPGLGRAKTPAATPRKYRLELESDFYAPTSYPLTSATFDVFQYNDQKPPTRYATDVDELALIPGSRYPVPSHVQSLRGRIREKDGEGRLAPIVGAKVSHQGQEVFSDGAGEFVLPVRLPATSTTAADESDAGSSTLRVEQARGYAGAKVRIGASDYTVTAVSSGKTTLTVSPPLVAKVDEDSRIELTTFTILVQAKRLNGDEYNERHPVDPDVAFEKTQQLEIPLSP